MNKSDLIRSVAEKSDKTIVEVGKTIEAFFDVLCDAVASNASVKLTNYLTVSVKHTEAKEGRNPRNGETITIPAKNRVVIKPGKKLKESANQ